MLDGVGKLVTVEITAVVTTFVVSQQCCDDINDDVSTKVDVIATVQNRRCG